MFIKQTKKRVGDTTYGNHLLVESVATPNGPRHRVVCSLGSLAPAPAEDWLALAHKIESALTGQHPVVADPQVARLVAQVQATRRGARRTAGTLELVAVHPDQVTFEEPREAGPVQAGHQLWQTLGLDAVLRRAGLSARTRVLTEILPLNRLVFPRSEHAMPDWVRRTALADILGESFATLVDESLYQTLDRLHPRRAAIERALAERERTLFTLDDRLFLYDLTSTYFEGQCRQNPQAKRGYSRDRRPDYKQVVVGLVVDRDGFPKAHEVFDGTRTDRTPVAAMLDALERRVGRTRGATVVVDRGMAFAETLQQITARGYHYLVASRQGERTAHLDDFASDTGWQAIVRAPSPTNPGQTKTRVAVP
jgi:predicted transcriptional regulator